MGSTGGRVCAEDKDMVKAIETNIGKYIQILVEVSLLFSPSNFTDHLIIKSSTTSV
ncbi:hypothetical protein LguiB_015344 [Lonicera macranthoides]